MKSLITLLSLSLLIASCNNADKEAEAKRAQDNLIQAQQEQIAKLQSTVGKITQEKQEQDEKELEAQRVAAENRRKQRLMMWKQTLREWNTQLDIDNVKLSEVSQYHLFEFQSTHDQNVRNASVNVERDKTNVQDCQDSISKYQN